MRFRFIESSRSSYPVDDMCECLDVSGSGYYAWRERGPSKRSKEDDGLKERIGELHQLPRGQSNLFCFSKTLHSFVAFSLRARLTKLCA